MAALKRRHLLIAAAAVAAVASGCGSGDTSTTNSAGIAALPLETCAKVEYGGSGAPAGLIVSDLPMLGDSAERSRQQVEAIRLALEDSHWMAGDTPVAFQACDDSLMTTGLWDKQTCRSNAEAYAGDQKVLGVIGTYNSGCAAEEIPILNKAPVAMISPGNTAVCLTEPSPICDGGQPQSLYPNGSRNYARVVPNDAFQGAALAELARQHGIERPFVLYTRDDSTSIGQAENFRGAAGEVGLKLAGYKTWDPKAKGYATLFSQVKRSGADGVILAGLTEHNGAQVIRDKVDVLGSNRAVPLIAFDGFAQQSTIDGAGSASRGMFVGVPGRAPGDLPPQGAAFVKDLRATLGDKPVEQFAPYAGEAAYVLLDAIAKAGPDRAKIIDAVFATKVSEGLTGGFDITPSGDPSVGPITVLKAGLTFEPYKTITPKAATVSAARG